MFRKNPITHERIAAWSGKSSEERHNKSQYINLMEICAETGKISSKTPCKARPTQQLFAIK